jgi:hypothetical protein
VLVSIGIISVCVVDPNPDPEESGTFAGSGSVTEGYGSGYETGDAL